jgi:hypothetical protein
VSPAQTNRPHIALNSGTPSSKKVHYYGTSPPGFGNYAGGMAGSNAGPQAPAVRRKATLQPIQLTYVPSSFTIAC